MKSVAVVIAIAFGVATAPGCRLARFAPRECVLGDEAARSTKRPPPIDLSALKLYRNTFAVSRVGPYEDHFTIWLNNEEPEYVRARVKEDDAGKIHIAIDSGMWGGIGAPPEHPKPPPADVFRLQEDLENEAHYRCPDARNWVIQYDGRYREIDLEEMMKVENVTNASAGWKGKLTLTADDSLAHVLPNVPDYRSGLGVLEIAEPMQWVAFTPPPNDMGRRLFVDGAVASKGAPTSLDPTLTQKTLEAARRFRDGAPSPTLAEIVATQGSTLLPPGLDPIFHVGFDVYGRTRDMEKQRNVVLSIPLKTSLIMNGSATGETDQDVGNVHLKMRAAFTLVPSNPPPDANGVAHVGLLLHLHVEDQRGHTFDRDVPASADFLTDGSAVVAPEGIRISDPKPDANGQTHGSFPEGGEIESVDFYLDIKSDPREP